MRVTPMAHAATPLGAGYGATRFASPTRAFKVIYLGHDLTTSVAEAIVRDRFQGKVQRRLMLSEVELWGAAEVGAATPLTLINLRTTGLVRLGVSTETARGKAQGQGRKLSQAVHDQTRGRAALPVAPHGPDLRLHLRARLARTPGRVARDRGRAAGGICRRASGPQCEPHRLDLGVRAHNRQAALRLTVLTTSASGWEGGACYRASPGPVA